MKHDPNEFFEYVGGSAVVCGECFDEDLRLTAAGELTGDEAVYDSEDFVIKLDPDEEVECDNCFKQSDNYGEEE